MNNLTPLKAIRRKCLDCSENAKEVKVCAINDCPLHKFRLGTNPARKGTGTLINIVTPKKGSLSGRKQAKEGIVGGFSVPVFKEATEEARRWLHAIFIKQGGD